MGRFFHAIARTFRAFHAMFTPREFHYRARGRIKYFRFTRFAQYGLFVLVAGMVSWVGFSTFYFVSMDRVLYKKNAELVAARKAQRDVIREVAKFNERLVTITQNLDKNKDELVRMSTSKDNAWINLKEVGPDGKPITPSQSNDAVMASHRALSEQLSTLSKIWTEINSRSANIEKGLVSIGTDVENMMLEHGDLKRERDRLRKEVKDLELRLVAFRDTNDGLVAKLDERTMASIEDIEKVIAMTGLDANKLVAEIAGDGKGGPLIEIPSTNKAGEEFGKKLAVLNSRAERWQHLQKAIQQLPLISPIDHYRLASGFGSRRDPITGGLASHNGIDLAYTTSTPVLSTAKGMVVFAGWRGGHGYMVEIDHGMGVRTRYAHLQKVLVAKGQQVEFREKIGLLGSTGRSTGPHVHYEVLVDGKPTNPMNFIMAGKYVFKG